MAKYDPLVKRLGRLKPRDFVEFIYPKSEIENVSFEDREFEFTHKRVDLLYKVKAKKLGEFYFHLEFQGEPEKDFLERLLIYSGRIIEEFEKPVKTVVIFLRNSKKIRELDCPATWYLGGEELIRMSYTKLILPEEDWEIFSRKGCEAFLPLIPLTKIKKGEEGKVLQETAKKIEKIKDKKIRQELAALFYIVGEDKYEELVKNAIGEKLMEELLESKILQSLEEKGKKEKAKENLIKLLRYRFKRIPKETKSKINELENVKELDSLFDKAFQIENLKAFEKLLDASSTKKI